MDTKTKKVKTVKKTAKKAKPNPKQAIVKINSLMKGIDNSVEAIQKHKVKAAESLKQIHSLMGGISNAIVKMSTQPKPEPKKPEPKKPEPKKPEPKKPAPKAAAKSPKPTKAVAKPVKTEAKPAVKKPVKTEAKPAVKKETEAKPAKMSPVAGRPSLKDAVKEVITEATGPMTAAEIWKKTTTKWGYWSRQSLYNVLRKSFVRQGDKFTATAVGTTDVETENFLKSVDENQAVSNVV